ncbi:hypothetical protein F4809DRAFT_217565 [Biscogniauxia mediterranea]|nr:hypothetical protein F4809DRAFT_217565 [Biscogniauxia mediterranea]
MHQPPNQKSTPNRRRPPLGRNRKTPQKAYASDNDVPSSKPDRSASPTTPQKSASGGTTFVRATSTNQKQRKGNKNRTKNGVVESTALLSKDDVSVPIFAGSTFHASPAPSALPIPSFLGVASATSPKTRPKPSPSQDLSPPTTDSDEDSQSGEVPVKRHDESPLEFFFRADRAEKARTRRASSANGGASPEAPFSPPHESPQGCNTFPRTTLAHPVRRPLYAQQNASPGISTNELDGTPGQPLGPAFSTPYQERIKAARSNQGSAPTTPSAARDHHLNSSEALKRYLFSGQLSAATQKPVQPRSPYQAQQPSPQQSPVHQSFEQCMQHGRRQPLPRQQLFQKHSSKSQFPPGMFPASILTGHGPSAREHTSSAHKIPSPPHRSEQILALEGDLRRMLKLDSSG